MSVTLGLVANVFNEANALPGWLETHTPYFDDIRILHAGPGGARSDDGTLEILEKWRVPVEFGSIDEGFGVVRTKAIHSSPCDYVMLLDADERFFPTVPHLSLTGEATPHSEVDAILRTYDFYDLANRPPDWANVARLGENLRVVLSLPCDQGTALRDILNVMRPDAVATVRRHWHDFSFKRPTQSWLTDCDWQLRVLRNTADLYYDPGTRMHERLVGAGHTFHADPKAGPFFDHFHLFFKRMEVEQRAHDVRIYDALHKGEAPPPPRAHS